MSNFGVKFDVLHYLGRALCREARRARFHPRIIPASIRVWHCCLRILANAIGERANADFVNEFQTDPLPYTGPKGGLAIAHSSGWNLIGMSGLNPAALWYFWLCLGLVVTVDSTIAGNKTDVGAAPTHWAG